MSETWDDRDDGLPQLESVDRWKEHTESRHVPDQFVLPISHADSSHIAEMFEMRVSLPGP